MDIKTCNVVRNSGFFMEGYHVWCGSVLKEDDTYYMFASRWKKETGFPAGYMTNSEIVLACTKDLKKPFKFERVIIGKRAGGFWDSTMAHNPFIVRAENGYYLYYIGSQDGTMEKRAIGYAFAKSLDGEWRRSEKPFELPPDANNPAVIQRNTGEILLYFRDRALKVSVAVSDSYEGAFKVLQYDIFPSARIEDMFVFKNGGEYIMVCEDAAGVYTGEKKSGVLFKSKDGVAWDENSAQKAYGFEIVYEDGKTARLQRRERPMILFDGRRNYLFTAAKEGGETVLEGGNTGNIVQEILLNCVEAE